MFCDIDLTACMPFQFLQNSFRALNKREYLKIIFLISHRNHNVVTPHLKLLIEMVQVKGHNICFYEELTKIIPNYHQILHFI